MLHCPQIPAALRRDADETRARRARMEAKAWHPPTVEPVDNPVSEVILAEKELETVDLAETTTTPLIPSDDAPPAIPRMPDILREVSKKYQIRTIDILSARRTADVVRPRQVVMYLARTLTLLSLPQIGRRLGGRDHTTALHGWRKITKLLPFDFKLQNDIAEIKTALGVAEEEL